jgi:hypothetical protein
LPPEAKIIRKPKFPQEMKDSVERRTIQTACFAKVAFSREIADRYDRLVSRMPVARMTQWMEFEYMEANDTWKPTGPSTSRIEDGFVLNSYNGMMRRSRR